MRQISPYPLWIGHIGDARDQRSVLSAGIEAMVDLAGNERSVETVRDLAYCRFPLVDGSGNPLWLVRSAIETVARLISFQVPTLYFAASA